MRRFCWYGASFSQSIGATTPGRRIYVYDGDTGTLRWSADGENAGDRFGAAVAFIDGAESVIYVGTPGYDVGDLTDAGRVYRLQQDGTLRTDIPLFESVDELQWSGPTAAFTQIAERLDAAILRPDAGPRSK